MSIYVYTCVYVFRDSDRVSLRDYNGVEFDLYVQFTVVHRSKRSEELDRIETENDRRDWLPKYSFPPSHFER